MSAPITCVITCYNNSSTLEATVRSVLRQSLPVSEILIADDNSTDGTRELIAKLAQNHDMIRPLLRHRNLGVAANRDLAIRAAAQPFVTHLDGDDLFACEKIDAEWQALAGRKDAVAYSLVGRVWPGKWWRTRVLDPEETVGDPALAFERLLVRKGAIPRDMLLSKELFVAAGGFTHEVPLYEDWQFKLRLARHTADWIHSGALGTLYMQHDHGLSAADRTQHRTWKARVRESVGANSPEGDTIGNMHFGARHRISTLARTLAHATEIRATLGHKRFFTESRGCTIT